MRKGSSKVASALQAKIEAKIDLIQADIDRLEDEMGRKITRRGALEEMREMLIEAGLADADESEAAA